MRRLHVPIARNPRCTFARNTESVESLEILVPKLPAIAGDTYVGLSAG